VSGMTALRWAPRRPMKDGGGGEEPDGSEGRQMAMSGRLLATLIWAFASCGGVAQSE
jgi:hypothetical protein